MRSAIVAPPTTVTTATKTKTERPARDGSCPNCETAVKVKGSTVRCETCKLTAPASAFTNRMESAKHSARAWTVSGQVD